MEYEVQNDQRQIEREKEREGGGTERRTNVCWHGGNKWGTVISYGKGIKSAGGRKKSDTKEQELEQNKNKNRI